MKTLVNEAGHLVREEVDGFFADRRVEDTLVLYLSCHGVKDPGGRLYFAASTTKLHRLASTAISADFVYEQVDRCRARRILLLLDCCYSGAYLKGHRPRGQNRAGVKPLEGRGRAVITSCTALEQAFELDTGQVSGAAVPSVFTTALVEGLRTGKADRDGDGLVSVDELYTYLSDRIREITPHQTPEKKWEETRGDFYIARNPCPPARPEPPPPNAGAGSHARKSPTTRRVFLGMAGLSTAGLAVTGWELARSNTTAGPRPHLAPTPTTLWTFPTNDQGTTVQAVTKGVVYASTGQPESFCALRVSNGEKLWQARADPLSGFVLSRDFIFSWVNSGIRDHLIALHANDGHRAWYSPHGLEDPALGPMIAGNVLYVADGLVGDVYALRASNGSVIWGSHTAAGTLRGMTAYRGVIYVTSVDDHSNVCALNANDGSLIWSRPSIHGATFGPVVAKGVLYFSSRDGRLHAMRADDGHVIWTFDSGPSEWILSGGSVIYSGGSHESCALRASDGARIWNFPGKHLEPRLAAGGIVYFASDDTGEMYALRASDGAKVWTFPAENLIQAVASANGMVYVASNNLYALRASDGARTWTFPMVVQAGNPGFGPQAALMVISGGVLYFGSPDGVHALSLR